MDFFLLAGLLVPLAILIYTKSGSKHPPLPPGPPRKFLVGNIWDLPNNLFTWEAYRELGRKYGPIISFSVPGKTIIVLNQYSKAVETLDKRGVIYSDRPHIPMVADLLKWKSFPSLLSYGKEFQEFRKVYHEGIGTPALVSRYHPQLQLQSKNFVKRLFTKPAHLREHCYHYSASVSLQIAYGYTVRDEDDELVSLSTSALEAFTEGADFGRYWVNIFPCLRLIPDWLLGASYRTFVRGACDLYPQMASRPFDYVKQAMTSGTAPESFTLKRLRQNISSEDEARLKEIAASFFVGGTDTSALILHTFFLAMLHWPSVQQKLHEEMDQLIGFDRLPTFDDQPNLPYLEAVIKEVLRVFPMGPVGFPHVTHTDDVFDGYFIPKGSIVFGNIMAMFRDPEIYHSPDEFIPERFMGPTPELHPRNIVYGFGRRICPGRFLAEASIWSTLAMVVAICDIRPEFDENTGKPIIPNIRELSSGKLVNTISPFPCKITPRRSEEKLLIGRLAGIL